MDAKGVSETSIDFQRSTRSYIPEDGAVVYHYLLKPLKLWFDEEWSELLYGRQKNTWHFQNLRQMSWDNLNSVRHEININFS
jgi:hypothetical protein